MTDLIRFKRGVRRDAVHPMMFAYLGAIAPYHYELTGRVMRVTSMRRIYKHGSSSKHSPKLPALCTAADIGRHALDDVSAAQDFCREIQQRYGARVGVVLEPEWLTVRQLERRFGRTLKSDSQVRAARKRVGPHIHLQLKGKLWKPWTRIG